MGLGGTAQGATTVFAIVLLVVVVLIALGLVAVVHRLSHRWLPAVAAAFGWLLVVSLVVSIEPLRDHYSAENREQRRAMALRDAVTDGANARVVSTTVATVACLPSIEQEQEHHTREVSTIVAPDSLDFRRDFEEALTRQGFTTSRGTVHDYGGPHDWLLGQRGRASVLVEQAYSGLVSVAVEDGCYQNEPPRDDRQS